MSRLGPLQQRLRRLGRNRRRARLALAAGGAAAALLGTGLLLFALDWGLAMSRPQRAVALAAAVGAIVWMWRRAVLPWLRRRETEIELALLVERARGIDSDLAAALQFQTPAARGWGSSSLRSAVVEQAAAHTPSVSVRSGYPRATLRRRLAVAAGLVVVWSAVAAVCPRHFSAFFQRLAFRPVAYPTSTTIVRLAIDGVSVDLTSDPLPPRRIAEGRAVAIAVEIEGRRPTAGELTLWQASGPAATLALAPSAEGAETTATGRPRFVATLPRLSGTVRYRCRLHDAVTPTGELVVVAPPVAEVQFLVTPPAYAGQRPAGPLARGLREIVVLEGSKVGLRLYCQKPLSAAVMAIGDRSGGLRPAEGQPPARDWQAEDGGPLETVLEPLAYSIQVTDVDGLALADPLAGTIHVEPDAPPRAALAAVTLKILPTARPTLYYKAADDLALRSLVLLRQVVRTGGDNTGDEVEIWRQTSAAPRREIEARHALDLSGLQLAKGDELRITLRATDDRGPRQGKSATSEPVVFHVTDQQGILAMMLESDRMSAEQLQSMIQRQLELGASR